MDKDLEHHYEHLAAAYDANWARRQEYVDWMEEQIHRRLSLAPGRPLADIGAGTGLFLQRLMERYAAPDRPITCVDPSQAMLDRLPDDPRLRPLRATAEELASGAVRLPGDAPLGGLLIKEAVHHFADLGRTLTGLAELLAPGGRIVIVTLPPKIGYPLFQSALDRFAERQPEPAALAGILQDAGLTTTVDHGAYPVRLDRDEWTRLVQGRWMSVLSSFPDAELAAGVQEIKERYPAGELEFSDTFAFVVATREERPHDEAPVAG
ncbi:class I SAM-dependent methyltransferase [Streptomyces sp. WMMC897]|uniref:class I SAM-dependent methyltransferase n=1 Tax=Streptomyces sp. WMMC897 TaxID=3014782 RepID=UPI0022B5F086|nr:class I SAM-dependent methyltransferase [Streptomyces sp. WMMC897]MCZ7416436.1 methyltransferase domain-containing protein [Streptomyces sp. WMMC897]